MIKILGFYVRFIAMKELSIAELFREFFLASKVGTMNQLSFLFIALFLATLFFHYE